MLQRLLRARGLLRQAGTWRWVLALGLMLALGACAAPTPPPPTPTPTPPAFLVVARPPDLAPWDADLQRCARRERLPLLVHEVARRALDASPAEVFLTWGDPPPATHAYTLGEEPVWAVTSGGNPVHDLTSVQIRHLFLGWVTNWRDLGGLDQGVRLWVPDEDDLTYPVLEALLFGVPPAAGRARVTPTPRAVLEALATTPGGVALLPARWLQADDLPPQAATWAGQVRRLSAEPLGRVPVVVYSRQEPTGPARNLIACLQRAP